MKNWHLFFLVLVLCGLSAALIPWIYNRSQQIDENLLTRNRELWNRNKPDHYQLQILVSEGADKMAVSTKVENGKLIVCRKNGSFISEEESKSWSVDGIFEQLQKWLNETARTPERHYLTARFHPRYGVPVRVVFRSRELGMRVEILVVIQTEIESSSNS